ncbi:MAG: acyltransferase [Zoogloeaceae bacterium]|jgi:peptidoglycan/LPS O-acetylase OafA/YrhL|nr:acyltransferase [Zoogloeaceae bacterium]
MVKLSWRPDIEGLRAVAVLLVIAAHIGTPSLAGGFVGVDVFFVLSGYLITALLTQELRMTGRIDFWMFYARRFRRLAPGLLLMLSVVCLFVAFALSPLRHPDQASASASASVWASNFYFAFRDMDYFGAEAVSNLFLHTWSLGVEEQFYLVWPLLLWLIFSGFRPADTETSALRRLKTSMALFFFVSLALCLWLTRAHPASAFYMMPARAWQFSLGALVWLTSPPPPPSLVPSCPPDCSGTCLAGLAFCSLCWRH